MQEFTDALHDNTSIKVLDLSNNHLTDTLASTLLSRLLQETNSNHGTIECLMLNKNQLMDITWLCRTLQRNTTLSCLSLADNQIHNLQPLVSLLQTQPNIATNLLVWKQTVLPIMLTNKTYRQCCVSMSSGGNLSRVEEAHDWHLGLYALVFAKVAKEPALLYGLFCELPHVWSASRRP